MEQPPGIQSKFYSKAQDEKGNNTEHRELLAIRIKNPL